MITGGNRGIGLHVVEKLLKCEMTVVMGENTTMIIVNVKNSGLFGGCVNATCGPIVLTKFRVFNLVKQLLLFLGVRDPNAAQRSIETFINEDVRKGRIFFEKCDTGVMQSVREFAAKVHQNFPVVHVLINNGEKVVLKII